MFGEFELIERFLKPAPAALDRGVALGGGDDAALLIPQAGFELAVSVDTSNADVHFPSDAPAKAIGHRALAVALSDLAAMGARSRWCLMALTTPGGAFEDEAAAACWLEGFGRGFHALCDRHQTVLAGGDVTRGPLGISVTVMGEVPKGQALTRAGARPSDLIAVTGALGGGAGGLALWQRGERDLAHPLLKRYLLPEPRLEAGIALRGIASAALDISDGLLADLGHLRQASNVGAELDMDALPTAEGLIEALGEEQAQAAMLGGGDDYELLVTLAPGELEKAQKALAEIGLALSVIGRCCEAPGVYGVPADAAPGWQHFHRGRP
ncbi:thiamine-phosphate kinase [Halomonas sp. PAMB 3264]|uniref:thiamine-phosphate kinase n=1 Tax=Halomonas sp. PAMB 3264 TaxID=3075222 RepID=UPI00289CE641|nr:thiamine-phosphate kinase [Halomonas sp. PAMB 3264]WNL43475.1 thiamine-phosphate kinase [Halomonas sp. PAMB 3264]